MVFMQGYTTHWSRIGTPDTGGVQYPQQTVGHAGVVYGRVSTTRDWSIYRVTLYIGCDVGDSVYNIYSRRVVWIHAGFHYTLVAMQGLYNIYTIQWSM